MPRGVRRNERLTCTCEVCSVTFEVKSIYQVEGKRQRFCSHECRHVGHRKPLTPERIAATFWKNVDKRGPDECWPWTGGLRTTGYGQFQIGHLDRKQDGAHRVSYEIHFGPIPKLPGHHGGCVLHRCDNRVCVNPAHLWLGTHTDNVRDMIAKGRGNVQRPDFHRPGPKPRKAAQSEPLA